MNQTPFVNPRGGYFTMNERGRLIADKQHNPNNVHMGERYYSRQGPMGNPRLAGYDNGNTRVPNTIPPIGGPYVPFDGSMDYTGKNTGMQMAMNKGLDNWGGHRQNDGTFRLPGYGDNSFQQGDGQSDYDDDYDSYYDNVPYSPGMEGPLYFS